jgi:hypothetical protein
MIHGILFPLILFVGAFFNGYVMPRRIRRQVAEGALSPKTGGRFCILWRCWAAVFVGLGVVALALGFNHR